ncbi:MAG: AEC family transporter [Solirubrobacterales bacterium]|nr:AEC family transporter [Solirubrobacterales bacterium]
MILIAALIVLAVAAGLWAEHHHADQSRRMAHSSLSLMLYLIVPLIIFLSTVGLKFTTNIAGGIGLAILAVAVVGVIAWLVARGPLRLDRPSTGSVIASTIQVNSAFLGLPVTAALLGSGVIAEAAVYDALVSAPVLLIGVFGVGAAFGSSAGVGSGKRIRSFLLRNPPLYAVIAGLLAPKWMAPTVLVDASHILVYALIPLSFFAVGVILATEAQEGSAAFPPPLSRPILTVLVLRLAVAPALLFLIAAPLIHLPHEYLLQSAMATGITALIVGHAYGLNLRIIAGAIVWSTAIMLTVGMVAQYLVPLFT